MHESELQLVARSGATLQSEFCNPILESCIPNAGALDVMPSEASSRSLGCGDCALRYASGFIGFADGGSKGIVYGSRVFQTKSLQSFKRI